MKKIIYLFCLIGMLFLTACEQQPKNTLKVGVVAGPEERLLEVAKQVAKDRYNLNIKIITFNDFNTPNLALADASIDANMFQTLAFLQQQIQARNYPFVVLGKTFIYPMGLYSKKIHNLSELADDAKVAIPNDPSNGARGLLLLSKARLIKLKSNKNNNLAVQDIISNPKHLRIIELDAAQLTRALDDVALAAINTNFAVPAGLSPTRDALFHEDKNDISYVNVVVAREQNKNDPRLQQLVNVLQSPEVIAEAKKLFGDGAIPAWQTSVSSRSS